VATHSKFTATVSAAICLRRQLTVKVGGHQAIIANIGERHSIASSSLVDSPIRFLQRHHAPDSVGKHAGPRYLTVKTLIPLAHTQHASFQYTQPRKSSQAHVYKLLLRSEAQWLLPQRTDHIDRYSTYPQRIFDQRRSLRPGGPQQTPQYVRGLTPDASHLNRRRLRRAKRLSRSLRTPPPAHNTGRWSRGSQFRPARVAPPAPRPFFVGHEPARQAPPLPAMTASRNSIFRLPAKPVSPPAKKPKAHPPHRYSYSSADATDNQIFPPTTPCRRACRTWSAVDPNPIHNLRRQEKPRLDLTDASAGTSSTFPHRPPSRKFAAPIYRRRAIHSRTRANPRSRSRSRPRANPRVAFSTPVLTRVPRPLLPLPSGSKAASTSSILKPAPPPPHLLPRRRLATHPTTRRRAAWQIPGNRRKMVKEFRPLTNPP